MEKSLDPDNRWYKLAHLLPCDKIEKIYNATLHNEYGGGGNKSARMMVGALIIKHQMNLSDKDTIELIRENPYMQYFVGLQEFTMSPIFDPSLFVTIRKRLGVETINSFTVLLMEASKEKREEASAKKKENFPSDEGFTAQKQEEEAVYYLQLGQSPDLCLLSRPDTLSCP